MKSAAPAFVAALDALADREPAAARARLAWLDLYRGIAVLAMIEAHVANTFLATAGWPAEWRVRLDYVNGLVAPAFLFIAGYAYGCGARRKESLRAHPGPRLRRLAWIAALGYAMHFPWDSIRGERWAEALALGTRMDILPCLAIAVAALVVLDLVGRRRVDFAVAGLTAVTLAGAPLASGWTGPFAAMANRTTGSLFPLLPWAAFAFAGFLVSDREPTWRRFFAPVLLASLAVALLGRADLSPVSAAFFFERLAWVLALAPICGAVAKFAAPRLVLFAGRESLVIYLAHLLLIALLERCGWGRLGVAPILGLLAGVAAASFAIAWLWRRLSVVRADRARRGWRRRGSSAPAA